MNLSDEDREDMIEVKAIEFQCAKTPEERREIWAQLSALIEGRSRAQVERLEKARGLR